MRTPNFLLKPSAYKADTLYSILPDDGGGDFAVASYVGNGTRVNSEGLIEAVASDTPRIDYHNGPGLLLEPTRKNQILRSYEFDNANWTKSAGCTVTADHSIAPNGVKEACLIEDTTPAGTNESVWQDLTFDDATAEHTFSVFVKFNTAVDMYIRINGNVTGDLGAVELDRDGNVENIYYTDPMVTAFSSEYYGNGWWRVIMSVDLDNTDTSARLSIYTQRNPNEANSIWVWGAQLEEGAFATSIIPTIGTALTRAYDTLGTTSLITAGVLSSATPTSFFILVKVQDLTYANRDSANYLVNFGSTNGRVAIASDGDSPLFYFTATDTSVNSYALTNTSHNLGLNMNGDGGIFYVDGVKVQTSVDNFSLTGGLLTLSGQAYSAKIKEIAIYNAYLTDAEAKALTS